MEYTWIFGVAGCGEGVVGSVGRGWGESERGFEVGGGFAVEVGGAGFGYDGWYGAGLADGSFFGVDVLHVVPVSVAEPNSVVESAVHAKYFEAVTNVLFRSSTRESRERQAKDSHLSRAKIAVVHDHVQIRDAARHWSWRVSDIGRIGLNVSTLR